MAKCVNPGKSHLGLHCLSRYLFWPARLKGVIFQLSGISRVSGETSLSKLLCLLHEKGSTQKEKTLLPKRFFLFRVDPFSEGNGGAG